MLTVPHLRLYAVGALMTAGAGLALAGFGRSFPGPVAALLLSMAVAAGGFYLGKRPGA
jgi:hypothetical protein